MEVSEYLVGSPAFKAGDTGDPRMAGSIPVHLRQFLSTSIRSVALLVAVCVVVLPSTVGAQARLISVTPEDGASLSNLEEVVFEFDSLLLPAGADVRVLRRDGTDVPVASIEVDRSTLTATLIGQLASGNYEVSYAVSSADGFRNEGSIRISVDSPEQALSGGLAAIIGLGSAMFGVMFFVLWRDQHRRPKLGG